MLTKREKQQLDNALSRPNIERIHLGFHTGINFYPGAIENGPHGLAEWPPLVILGTVDKQGTYAALILGYLSPEQIHDVGEYLAPYQSGGKFALQGETE